MTNATTSELAEIAREAEAGDDVPDIDSQNQVDCWRAEHEMEVQ